MEGTITALESEKSKFITKTYAWMGLALLISALSAFYTVGLVFRVPDIALFLYRGTIPGVMILSIAELIIVFALSATIRKISFAAAIFAFLVYAVLNGVTLSSIFLIYQIQTIAAAFTGAAAMFLIMAVYGAVTKNNLASWGHYLIMALAGIILVSLIQFIFTLFFHFDTSMLDFLISVATIIIFTGLTAYDSQKIMKVAQYADHGEDYKKVSILAALELYLDFINLFLALLRLLGRRK